MRAKELKILIKALENDAKILIENHHGEQKPVVNVKIKSRIIEAGNPEVLLILQEEIL